MASFSGVSDNVDLTFTSTAAGGEHIFSWEPASFASTNSGPVPIEHFEGDRPRNQCTFIRGFKVSLNRGLWAFFGRRATLSDIVDVEPVDISSRTSFVPFRHGSSSLGCFPFRSRSEGNGQARESPASNEIHAFVTDSVSMASDVPPRSYVSASATTYFSST